MGRYNASPRNDSFADRKKLWNPCDTLGIINSDPGYQRITCVGYAPSQGRRCRNPINANNRDFIMDTLEEIGYVNPDSATVISRLRAIASRALCVRYHQNQAGTILEQWRDKIETATPRSKERQYTKSTRSYTHRGHDRYDDAGHWDDTSTCRNESSESESENESKTESERKQGERRQDGKGQGPDTKKYEPTRDMEEVQEQLREMKKLVAELQEALRRQRQEDPEADDRRREKQEAERKQEEDCKCRERLRREREEREQEARIQKEEREEKERKEREREEQEQEQRNKERREEERQEQQRKEKEEQGHEQMAREYAAFKERIRQKAQKVREEKEKAERERLQKEREEWDVTWTAYQKSWTEFKSTPNSTYTQATIRAAIPWPVKSGLHKDITRPAVKEFFRTAPPQNASPTETIKLIRLECAKWHPDKSHALFHGCELNRADQMIMELVCHVLFEIRDEALEKKRGGG